MKIVNDIFHDLVEKKLWPVAALLVIAIVAVPMQLSKPGDPAEVPAVPTAAIATDTGPELALTRAAKTGFARAPRVNEDALDPFGERTDAKAQKAMKALRKQLETALSGLIGDGGSGGGGGAPIGDGSLPPVSKAPSDPAPPKEQKPETELDDLLSLLVTVGDGNPTQLDDVRTLSPLPDATNPFLVYTGKNDNGAAVFIVSADVQVTSGGRCEPTPEQCVTLTLAEGETAEFKLLVGGGTVSVTIVGIETKRVPVTGDAASTAALELKARRVGARVLRDGLDNPLILKSLHDQRVRIRP